MEQGSSVAKAWGAPGQESAMGFWLCSWKTEPGHLQTLGVFISLMSHSTGETEQPSS